jgi:hypothetical protein
MLMTADVRQHQKSIHPGDRVYLWESGKLAGVVGVAEVLTEPGDIQEEAWKLEFHVERGERKQLFPHVRLKIITVLPKPLLRGTIKSVLALKNLLILRFGQQTNYPLTEEQGQALDRLISADYSDTVTSTAEDPANG